MASVGPPYNLSNYDKKSFSITQFFLSSAHKFSFLLNLFYGLDLLKKRINHTIQLKELSISIYFAYVIFIIFKMNRIKLRYEYMIISENASLYIETYSQIYILDQV